MEIMSEFNWSSSEERALAKLEDSSVNLDGLLSAEATV
jgi:hypothetical protein